MNLNIVNIVARVCKMVEFDRQLGRSLVYNGNDDGPKMVPWGTPQLKEQMLQRRPFMEHVHLRMVL